MACNRVENDEGEMLSEAFNTDVTKYGNYKQSNTSMHLFKKKNPQKHIQQFVFYPQKQINPIVLTNTHTYIYNQLTVSCLSQRNLINCQGYLAADQIHSEETNSSEQIHCSVCSAAFVSSVETEIQMNEVNEKGMINKMRCYALPHEGSVIWTAQT